MSTTTTQSLTDGTPASDCRRTTNSDDSTAGETETPGPGGAETISQQVPASGGGTEDITKNIGSDGVLNSVTEDNLNANQQRTSETDWTYNGNPDPQSISSTDFSANGATLSSTIVTLGGGAVTSTLQSYFSDGALISSTQLNYEGETIASEIDTSYNSDRSMSSSFETDFNSDGASQTIATSYADDSQNTVLRQTVTSYDLDADGNPQLSGVTQVNYNSDGSVSTADTKTYDGGELSTEATVDISSEGTAVVDTTYAGDGSYTVTTTTTDSSGDTTTDTAYYDGDGNPVDSGGDDGSNTLPASPDGVEVHPDGGGVKAVPTVTVTDYGGTYTGQPFPAVATVAGLNHQTGGSLEGVNLTLAYYPGTSASACRWRPSNAGTYTVVASFAGSQDYAAAGASATFTITPAADNCPRRRRRTRGPCPSRCTRPQLAQPAATTPTDPSVRWPQFAGISPASGPGTGGTTVTISGNDYYADNGLANATGVYFGTVAASILSDTDNQIVVVSPPGTGTVDITVVTLGGVSTISTSDQFSYSTYTVTNTSDSGSVPGSLPWAVARADADTSGTAITIDLALPQSENSITLSGTLELNNPTPGESITIDGANSNSWRTSKAARTATRSSRSSAWPPARRPPSRT